MKLIEKQLLINLVITLLIIVFSYIFIVVLTTTIHSQILFILRFFPYLFITLMIMVGSRITFELHTFVIFNNNPILKYYWLDNYIKYFHYSYYKYWRLMWMKLYKAKLYLIKIL